ncbi:integrase [Massilia violaceinigra]|uniref:Integrase n=1 Tax=Massilia violaceinigra TaxID=2045208 RepID=A0ABY4AB97_9BURK|nr:integrase [Massilia violaceinigra]UOD31963.1 integrase [Massilia violaceinigra]
MLTSATTPEHLAVVRLLELLSDSTPWNRSLWGIGIVLALDELYEACAVMAQGHLSELAVKRVMASLNKRVGLHPGFTGAEKKLLHQHLQQVPRADSVAHYTIRQVSALVAADYLLRWGRVVEAGNLNVELFARSVAGHLLDAGFSGHYLRDFIGTRIEASAPPSLAQLCGELHREMFASPPRDMEVLLAFGAVPRLVNGVPPSWLTGAQVGDWLRRHGIDSAAVRAPVALVITVRARDAAGAAQRARSESDRYAARALLATGLHLNRLPTLWVAGSAAPFDLDHDRRGVEVKELYREDRIFCADANHSVDAALDLLAHLDGSSPVAAVAGGWGAIEGLLAAPADRSTAAGNLASLVTCSFPRAELTRLAHLVRQQCPGRYPELDSAASNRARSRIVGGIIIAGGMPPLPGLSDQAAVTRMRKLFHNPREELATIRAVIADAFHRLYRQRNLILHAGKLDSVALTPGLRTVAKLAGAGMDRVTHGHYVQQLEPLDLVAKANMALALVDAANPLQCVELLETD